jgi:hypothetical protein
VECAIGHQNGRSRGRWEAVEEVVEGGGGVGAMAEGGRQRAGEGGLGC